MKQAIKNIILTATILAAVYFCIRYPGYISGAVNDSIIRCTDVMIPSMFIFMCISSITVNSGLHSIISIPFRPAAKYIFRLSDSQFGVFMLSLVSGYPAGIKLLADCYNKNALSKNDFDRLSCFCFASGPAFIIGTISGVLYPDTPPGIIVFLSVTAGNILSAVLCGLFSRIPSKEKPRIKTDISAECFINSTVSSARAIFQMCVMIVAFSGVLQILKLSGVVNLISEAAAYITGNKVGTVSSIIACILEISNIITLPKNDISMLPVVASLLSFGGICVLIQIIAISGGLLNIKKFISVRLFSAFASALFCRLFMKFINIEAVTAFAPAITHSKFSPLPSVLLIIMTLMLLSITKNYGQSDKKML